MRATLRSRQHNTGEASDMTESMGLEDDAYPKDWDPESVLIQGLLADELGHPFDSAEMADAAMLLAAAMLVAQGVPEDTAISCVEEAIKHGDIHVSLSADGRLNIVIGELKGD